MRFCMSPHDTHLHRGSKAAPYDAQMHRRNLLDPRANIRTLREARGFTSDRALAIAAGIPQPTLSRYLSGTTDSMDFANFQALARVLEVSVSELIGEVPVGSESRLKELTGILQKLPEPELRAWLAAGHAMADATKKKP
jgi:transcriptional regulator with XRE-family HTH domain